MRCFHLTSLPPEEERTLQEMERHHPTPRVRRRATVVLMSQRGLDQSQIARALGVSWPFVHKALGLYEARGFLGLVEHHPGACAHLTPEQTDQVIHWVEQGPKAYHYRFAQWDTRTLQWRIWQVYGIKLCREAIRKLLHRQGFSWKRPKSTYARVDEKARAQTQKGLDALLQKARKGKIVLLLQDEALATLVTTLQCGWSRRGIQLAIPSTGQHDEKHRCAVFAVVNPGFRRGRSTIASFRPSTRSIWFAFCVTWADTIATVPFRSGWCWTTTLRTSGSTKLCNKPGFVLTTWLLIVETSMPLSGYGPGCGSAISTTSSSKACRS